MRRFSHRDEDTRQHDNLVRDADAAARKGERMKAIRFLESAVAWVPQISTLLKLADLRQASVVSHMGTVALWIGPLTGHERFYVFS